MSDDISVNAEARPGYIDYKDLPFVKARVKFYNQERGFGFVTLLDDNGNTTDQDAFLPGTKLEQAGYEEISPQQEILVKHTNRPKGEAVVLVKHPPGYSNNSVDITPVKIKPRNSDTRYRSRDSEAEMVDESEDTDNEEAA